MHAPFIEAIERELARHSGEPIYHRIVKVAESALAEGLIERGSLMPSERQMAERLGISRVTVRKALEVLAETGLVTRHQGSRSRVAGRVEKSLSTLTSFSEDMASRGLIPGCRWLSREIARPSPAEAMALGLSPTSQVSRLRRIRTANGNPIAIETAALPVSVLNNPQLVTDSLYAVLAQTKAVPERALQRMQAAQATAADAEHLALELPASLLVVERRCFGGNGNVVEFTQTRYRGDAYDFLLELRR